MGFLIILICAIILVLIFKGFNKNPYAPLGITDAENASWEEYQKHIDKTAPIFTANQIIAFYNTAPNKWEYMRYRAYKEDERYITYPHILYNSQTEITVDNIQDFATITRYFDKVFAERKAKEDAEAQEKERIKQEKRAQRQKEQRYKNTLALLPKLREDARLAEEEANKMMEKCERETKEIAARLQAEEG